MRVYRYLAGAAAVVITVVGMATVTAGSQQPPPPPAVHLRGQAITTTSVHSDGLEFVPAPVIDMNSTSSSQTTTSTEAGPSSTTSSLDSPDVRDDSDYDERSADTPDSASSPDD